MAASIDIKKHLLFETTGHFVIENWNTRNTLTSTVAKVPQISGQWWIASGACLSEISDPRFLLTLESINGELTSIQSDAKTRYIAIVEFVEASFAGAMISINSFGSLRRDISSQKSVTWLGSILRGNSRTVVGKLEMKCTLSVFMEFEEKSLPIWIAPSKDLESDIHELYADDDLKDFTFKVGDQDFKVHKLVLSRASPVFKTMFTCGLDETKLNFAMIEECEPEVFKKFLLFIYAGKIPEDLRSVSMQLYELAHCYNIPRLTRICLDDIMKIRINNLNCLEIYQFAIKFELKDLLNNAWNYIKKNLLDITEACGPKPLKQIEILLEAKDEYKEKLRSFLTFDCKNELSFL